MLPFLLQLRPRVGAAAGLAGIFALCVFAGCRTPSNQSLLTAPLAQRVAGNLHASPANGLIAGQAEPALYLHRSKPTYRVINLGTLTGASYATAISNQGKVVGFCSSSHVSVAFLWKSGHLRRLGRFSAFGINNHGQIVGFEETKAGVEKPLLKSGARTTVLGTLPGAAGTYGYRINDRGQVIENTVGGPDMPSRALLWSGRRVWPLWILPGFRSCQAEAINSAGMVAGAAMNVNDEQHACLWLHGYMRDLGSLPKGRGSIAQGINERGDVVGSSGTPGGVFRHAFLWQHGRMRDLGTVDRWPQSDAEAINDQGLVVGSLERPSPSNRAGAISHAFLWRNGKMVDLNSLISRRSGWVLTDAVDINNRGEIVGNGTYQGKKRAFLLMPKLSSLGFMRMARNTPKKATSEKRRVVALAAIEMRSAQIRRAERKTRVAFQRSVPAKRRRPVVERVAAYQARYRAGMTERRAVRPGGWRPIPIGFQGIVVARAAGRYTYRVQYGNLSRNIYLGPGKRVKTGDEIRIRGALQRNGVVTAGSFAHVGRH